MFILITTFRSQNNFLILGYERMNGITGKNRRKMYMCCFPLMSKVMKEEKMEKTILWFGIMNMMGEELSIWSWDILRNLTGMMILYSYYWKEWNMPLAKTRF